MTDTPFRDKVVLVTGAGSGIGRATALLFAERGAAVVATDLDGVRAAETADAITSAGGTALGLEVDVSDEQAVAGSLTQTVERFGGLDVLINNAGFAHYGAVADTSVEDWDRSMAVNARGVFLHCKHAVGPLTARGGGAIVNVASRVGLRGIPNMSAYSASKGAVVLFTYSLALELAAAGIRVNCVCPASVATPALDVFWPRFEDPAATREAFEQAIPLGRMATAEEIAEAVAFLAGDGSSFITGVALPVDGGRTAGS